MLCIHHFVHKMAYSGRDLASTLTGKGCHLSDWYSGTARVFEKPKKIKFAKTVIAHTLWKYHRPTLTTKVEGQLHSTDLKNCLRYICQNFAKVFTLCVGYFSVSLNRTITFNKRIKCHNLAASIILLNTMTFKIHSLKEVHVIHKYTDGKLWNHWRCCTEV